MKKTIYYGKYTLAFCVIAGIMMKIFHDEGKSFVYLYDATEQHIVAIEYISQYIREAFASMFEGHLVLPSFDLAIGQGNNIFTTLAYYGLTNPIYWLAAFFPVGLSEECFAFIYFLQLYLCGISFLFLINRMAAGENRHSWVSAIVYTFQSFSICWSLRHPIFLAGMIFLPIMIAYARDVLLFQKSGGKLAVCTALCIYAHFYSAYINLMLLFVYVVIFTSTENIKDKRLGRLLSCGMWCLTGVFLAAPLLLPVGMTYIESYRSRINPVINILYDKVTYATYLTDLFFITLSSNSGTFLGVSGICALAVMIFFSRREKNNRSIRAMILIMAAVLIFPVGGWVLNGFAYSSNRWCYGLILMCALCVAYMELDKITAKQTIVLLVLTGLICVIIWICTGGWSRFRTGILVVELTFGLLPQIVNEITGQKSLGYKACGLINLVICLFISINISLCFDGTLSVFNNAGEVNDILVETCKEVQDTDDLFRVTSIHQSSDSDMNYSMLSDENSLSSYWSVLQGRTAKYYLDFDLYSIYSAHKLGDFGFSLPLNTLAGVKFVYSDQDVADDLYGYQKKNDGLYENEYSLPLGYVYTSTISEQFYSGLNPVEKMQSLMQGCVLADVENCNDNRKIKIGVLESSVSNIKLSNIIQVGDRFIAEAGGEMTFYYNADNNVEAYLYLNGLELFDDTTNVSITLHAEDITESTVLRSKEDVYYFNHTNFLFPIGTNHRAGQYKCSIVFSSRAVFTLKSASILSYDLSDYMTWINDLQTSTLQNISLKNDVLTGTIDSKDSGYLFLTIPYSKGWTAYVDENAVELVEANHLYMALEIDEGYHEIKLVYRTPGATIGLIIGGIGLIMLILSVTILSSFICTAGVPSVAGIGKGQYP